MKTRLRSFFKQRRQAIRIIGLIVLMVFSTFYMAIWSWQQSYKDEPLVLGVSYSKKYADELGIDWQRGLLTLMDELEIKHFRFMSYWDAMEGQRGEFYFDELDWQMDQAARHNATVNLAIGQRQPRWPECHIPEWAKQLEAEEYKAAVLNYIRVITERYHDHPALHAWQLENEAANRLFGECEVFDNTFLAEEQAVIKGIDKDTPVVINVSNQSGVPVRQPVGDQTGFSVYQRAHFEAAGRQVPWSFWYVPGWWHGWRAMAVEHLHGRDRAFIHELQAEPWGPKPTVELSLEEQNETMDLAGIQESVSFAKATGMREIYLWGGEWWYWRLTEFNDKELWRGVGEIFQESS